jgi:hypothetical protein
MGSISPLFEKMLAIHNKHGPFELALCVGDFFGPLSGDDDSNDVGRLLGGELRGSSPFFVCQKFENKSSESIVAPIPCYVMQGEHPLPDRVIEQFSKTSGELCNNVFLLSGTTLLVSPSCGY